MPGSIKVSGAQRTIAAPYVKVSGSWRTASLAYIKVDGSWRQWYAAEIVDNFNRANASTLGTVSNGVTSWTALKGTWAIVSNAAVGTGTYPMATVTNPLQLSNYELKADVTPGTGLAFWVTDANNWWAAINDVTAVTNYSCPNGGALSSDNTTCTITTTSNATTAYSGPYTYVPAGSSTSSYYASLGSDTYVKSNGGNCQNCSSSQNCYAGGCWTPGKYYCPNGGTLINDQCYTTTSYSAYCTPQGTYQTVNGSTGCYTAYYVCPSGSTLSGSTCTATSTYTPTATVTYTNFIKVLQSAAGTVTTQHSFSAGTSTATNTYLMNSLKVTTSNNTISVIGYTGAGQTGTSYSTSHVSTAPATTATAGIIVAPASSGQGYTLDNFGLK